MGFFIFPYRYPEDVRQNYPLLIDRIVGRRIFCAKCSILVELVVTGISVWFCS